MKNYIQLGAFMMMSFFAFGQEELERFTIENGVVTHPDTILVYDYYDTITIGQNEVPYYFGKQVEYTNNVYQVLSVTGWVRKPDFAIWLRNIRDNAATNQQYHIEQFRRNRDMRLDVISILQGI